MSASAAVVLALNCGSSSLKFGLFHVSETVFDPLVAGMADATGAFEAKGDGGRIAVHETHSATNQQAWIERIEHLLRDSGLPTPAIVGHRVVHGGPHLLRHCRIDDAVLAELETASGFAPLHIPTALSAIRFAQTHFPDAAQIACFDTAFHAGMPAVARTLPLPYDLRAAGIHRYGFHGLSCESILRQVASRPAGLPKRLIVAHLGNGASITAVAEGRSVDTSMGLTPTGGVMMSTRSGDLDPGILLYLMRARGLDAPALETLLDHQSGLLGVSGISGDLRPLHAAPEPEARLAIDMFCYQVAKTIAGMIVALDGIDLIVFTGGIGEHDATVRAGICGRLGFLGIDLDPARNAGGHNPIGGTGSPCMILVLVSEEDEQIARHSWALMHPR